MRFNFSKYSKQIKVVSIIPFILGLLTFSELLLPNKNIETTITSKNESYRAKFDRTTYNIYFDNNNDQFTKDIFNSFEVGDKVILTVSYFHEETSKITDAKSGKVYKNATGEVYFHYLFALIFTLPGLSWIKKRSLNSKQVKYITFIILISLVSYYRLLK